MANIKSKKKRAKQSQVCRINNMSRRSEIKTCCKKLEAAVEEKNVDLAKTILRDATSKIARACGKGLYKKNTAARKVSRLAKKVAQVAR